MENLNYMKIKTHIFAIILCSFTLLSFSQTNDNYKSYGDSFDFSKTIDYELNKKSYLNTDDKVKVEGEILSTCPMKGCWMKLSVAQDTILVRFKDYGFFVPKQGAEGKSAIVNGNISVDTLSIAQLKHYAEDAGKSKDEISKISKPEITISFLADGVVIGN